MTRQVMKTAAQLGLPQGDAVLRDGKVTILPRGHSLDSGQQWIDPTPFPQMPQTAHIASTVNGGHTDRSIGFTVVTAPMSLIFGIVAVIVAATGWNTPIISMTMLFVFWLSFLGWWLIAWLVHQVFSAEGAALLNALLGFRIIRQEQRYRNERYRDGS